MRRFSRSYAALGWLRDEAALDRIYYSMRAGRGSLKRTFRHRLTALDGVVQNLAYAIFPSSKILRVHDVGASNAITSMELFEAIGHRCAEFVASDFYDAIYVRRARFGLHIVYDAECEMLQVGWWRIGYRVRRHSRLAGFVRRIELSEQTRISLFHPQALAKARKDSRFVLRRENLLAPPQDGTYDIVRAMNVLATMDRDTREAAIAQLKARVADGGLLIMGSEDMPTILLRSGDTFSPAVLNRATIEYLQQAA